MRVVDDISGTVYKDFIKYAVSKSNAFMFVVNNRAAQLFDSKQLIDNFKKARPQLIIDEEVQNYWKGVEDSSKEEVNIFACECSSFIERFAPHLIKQRFQPIDGALSWPYTTVCDVKAHDYDINLYRSNEELVPLLLAPKHIYGWRYPHFPEDLSFFSDNHCWFLSSSHEEEITIFPRSKKEYDTLIHLGIEFYDNYGPTQQEWMFYEDYNV